MTFAEIKDRLNFDLETHEEVLEKVCRNERISYDAGQLSYKHLYDVRNEADLIKTLREHVEIGGILVQDLRQSFPKIDEYLQVYMPAL